MTTKNIKNVSLIKLLRNNYIVLYKGGNDVSYRFSN